PDPRAMGLEGRAVRNAAWRALKPEVLRRLQAIAGAEDGAFRLDRDGRIRFEAAAVARLMPGAGLLTPRLALIGADTAPEPARNAASARLEAWLSALIATELKPLVALEAA